MNNRNYLITITTIITILLTISCQGDDIGIEVKSWEAPQIIETLENGVKCYQGRVHFNNGPSMLVKIYEPALGDGEKAPSVFIAPAGTPLITGMILGDEDSPEHIPYGEKGIYTVAYELAGYVNDYEDIDKYKEGIRLFTLFNGGVTNGKAAIDYALEHFKEIDSDRLYSAGHSSAGTVSLMMGVYEPRLRGVIAYAPGLSIEKNFGKEDHNKLLIYYGLDSYFSAGYSPTNNTRRLKCPIFLFQAKDDSVAPYEDMQRFYERLVLHNKNVTYKIVDEGDHYYSMLYEGIPAGIEWILTDK